MDTTVRSWWMVAAMVVTVLGNCMSRAGEIYVMPDGTPDGSGTKQSPVDLTTATTNSQLVSPGTTVWIGPGTYRVGSLQPHESIHGTKDKPIIYRALLGRPVTVVGEIRPNNDHVWYWGLDVKGGVTIRVRSTGLKLINLTIHEAGPAEKPAERKPSGQGIGGGDVGDDHKICGNTLSPARSSTSATKRAQKTPAVANSLRKHHDGRQRCPVEEGEGKEKLRKNSSLQP